MKLTLLIAWSLAMFACTERPGESTIESRIDACTLEDVEYPDFEATLACPAHHALAIGSIVQAGGTCTVWDVSKACASIDPISDETTKSAATRAVSCTSRTTCRKDTPNPMPNCEGDDPFYCYCRTTTTCCLRLFGTVYCDTNVVYF